MLRFNFQTIFLFRTWVLLGLSLFLQVIVFAGPAEDFSILKNQGRNLYDTGAICEQVSQLDFQKKYPSPEFRVLTGIRYADQDGPLGELDVVVFKEQTKQALVIAEVKCWGNPAAGLKKAKDQRQRFLQALKSSRPMELVWLQDPQIKFSKNQFSLVTEFLSVSQKGGKKVGYDLEMAYTLQELMNWRQEIMRCQAQGVCKKP